MCGIAVTIDLPQASADGVRATALELTKEMVERLRPRGPDDASIMKIGKIADAFHEDTGPEVVLGHTRLAIVGGADAKSPFVWSGDDGTKMALVHNGEIYNFKQLKQQMIDEGCCAPSDFSTECDSQVLLACCAKKGFEWTLSHISGMFAFVVVEWSEGEACVEIDLPAARIRRVIAARDAFGIKPLCCAFDRSKSRIILASQISAIPPSGLADGVQVKDILPGNYVEYTFQQEHSTTWKYKYRTNMFIPSDFDLRKILPGHHIKGFSYSYTCKDKGCLDTLRTKLVDAVQYRIPPLGSVKTAVLLSGGLDSSLITSIAAGLVGDEKLHTFNMSFREDIGTDKEYARLVRDYLPNVHHEEVTFTFQEGLDVLPQVIGCLETYDAVSVRAGVPLYLLSKHIKSLGFKVVLCGEGADEVFAGYRLFEAFRPSDKGDMVAFRVELYRRLKNIDTSELQRVDRCTSAHGLEARVPFLDLAFVSAAMQFPEPEKMSHISLGRIQKYILRLAFNVKRSNEFIPGQKSTAWLPDLVLFREKEQLADGIGRGWIESLQDHAIRSEGILNGVEAEKALYRRIFEQGTGTSRGLVSSSVRRSLVSDRQRRRQQGWPTNPEVFTGAPQSSRWHPASHDTDLNKMDLTVADARKFLSSILGWPDDCCTHYKPTLDTLNRLTVSMLERVPFHNLTLLLRERRPPTVEEIKEDMMSGIGGPCSVVNTFFAALLVTMGFGSNVYLLSCRINGRDDCHVAILVQIEGLRFFVDVANAKPYTEAVHLGDYSLKKSLNDSFEWNLALNSSTRCIELLHFGRMALSFDPTVTVHFRSFRDMIVKSRSDPNFGPFLTGLRICLYSNKVTLIKAVRDIHIYDGASTKDKICVKTRDDIRCFAEENFSHIDGFHSRVSEALGTLDRECPDWFDRALSAEASKDASKTFGARLS